jgi:hypothetical protein
MMAATSPFLQKLAAPLLDELRAVKYLKDFAANTDVIGAHAEAVVRRLVSRTVSPLRVSTGAVIDEALDPKNVPQVDTIIWSPNPMPALFEVGDFGIVPRGSVMALMEIKRSAYGMGPELARRLSDAVVAQFVVGKPEGWPPPQEAQKYPDYQAMGVICLREAKARSDAALKTLVAEGRCVVLLDEQADGDLLPNPEGACRLINFLVRARQLAMLWNGRTMLNLDAL